MYLNRKNCDSTITILPIDSCTTPVTFRKLNMNIFHTVAVRSNTSAAHHIDSSRENTLSIGTSAMYTKS